MFVEELWLPDNSPPQILPSVVDDVNSLIIEHGAIAIVNTAAKQLETNQDCIQSYLDEFGFELNKKSTEGFWPYLALRVGAALAYLSYAKSNLTVPVEKTFDSSKDIAEFNGIPESFIISAYEDVGLQSILATAFQEKTLQAEDDMGLQQVATIGAGCIRFFIHEALFNG